MFNPQKLLEIKEYAMKKVETGKEVKVHYTGTLESGEVFDSSEGREPLKVTVGQGHLISGFEDSLMGMGLNEKKTFTLEPESAYGERDESAIRRFPRKDLPRDLQVSQGQMLGLKMPDGQQIPAKVAELDDETVTLDLNHPLAGQSLTFAIEVVAIE
jgi:peptidylprolyl isomerase